MLYVSHAIVVDGCFSERIQKAGFVAAGLLLTTINTEATLPIPLNWCNALLCLGDKKKNALPSVKAPQSIYSCGHYCDLK